MSEGNQVGIVILAAGGSSRLGQPKQLLLYRGKTLLRHTVDTALAVESAPVIVVLGAYAETIRAELAGLDVALIENSAWSEGMGSSVRVGLEALLAMHVEIGAVLFLLCDQPLLKVEMLRRLIERHREDGCAIAASEYGDALGAPALFDKRLFPELLTLPDAAGAKQIIERHREDAVVIPFAGGVIDIDTADDYKRLTGG
jgi:molybdenum cofactor cytidylyltransferase